MSAEPFRPIAIDEAAIRQHCEIIHGLAAPLAGNGKLIIARFAEDPNQTNPKTRRLGLPLPPTVVHAAVGDVETTVRTISNLTVGQHANVYAPLAVFRPDLRRGGKGYEKDIVAVLGLCADFDDPDASRWAERLPLPPDFVLETSAGRFQCFFLFDKPQPTEAAKAVAERLKAFAGCDHGSSDMSHVWRVAGSLNWPNGKKVHEYGRSPEPQLVRVCVSWGGSLTSIEELAAALPQPAASPQINGFAAIPKQPAAEGPQAGGADVSVDLLVKQLPQKLRKKITEPTVGDRSKAICHVVNALAERGCSAALIEQIIRTYPAGIGEKYVDRNDLSVEVARILSKTSTQSAPEQHDVDSELEAIQKAIAALTENDPGTEAIIERIAAAKLPPLAEAPLIKNIKRLTGIIASAIDKTLKTAKRELQKATRQDVQTASWGVLVKRYAEASDNPGEIRPMMVNVAIIIRNTPEFRDAIWYNEFTDLITVRRPLPWDSDNGFKERDWTDYDELKLTEWLQGMDDFINAPPHVVFQGVETVAREQRYHPVRDYLDSLVWDGVPRIDRLLSYYFGCEREDPDYLKAISAKSLIQAVARIRRPGVKADCMLTLEGEQGIKKSTGLRMLFDPLDQGWFSDDAGELGTTDSKMKIRGKWGVELGEFAGLTKRGIRQAKAYLSSTDDEYRPPYGRRQKKFPRQNVFISSTNDEEVLNDASGGRRFWFAWCNCIDTDALWNDRHQLWAEAVHRYRNGERWHIDDPDIEKAAKDEQAKRQETDAWDDVILDYLKTVKEELYKRILTAAAYEAMPNADKKSAEEAVDAANTGVTTSEILTEKLGKRLADIENRDQQRVGNILRRLEWQREQIRKGPMRGKTHYMPPSVFGEDEKLGGWKRETGKWVKIDS